VLLCISQSMCWLSSSISSLQTYSPQTVREPRCSSMTVAAAVAAHAYGVQPCPAAAIPAGPSMLSCQQLHADPLHVPSYHQAVLQALVCLHCYVKSSQLHVPTLAAACAALTPLCLQQLLLQPNSPARGGSPSFIPHTRTPYLYNRSLRPYHTAAAEWPLQAAVHITPSATPPATTAPCLPLPHPQALPHFRS
jgi:hypothetical protein